MLSTDAITSDAIKNQIELMLAINRLPLRASVSETITGWTILVDGIVPEQFQEGIWSYLLFTLGLTCRSINFIWQIEKRTTTIELKAKTA